METWDTIRARRNVRQYTDQPIARADLERILDAGRRAASASNWQPWNFVVVTDRPQLVELAKVWQGARHVARSAATVAFVVRQPEDTRQPRPAHVRPRASDGEHDAGRHRPRHRLRSRRGVRPGASAARARVSRWLLLRVPDRSGLPGRPPATPLAGRTGGLSTRSSIGTGGRRVHRRGRAFSR